MKKGNINSDDVFIFDLGLQIYQVLLAVVRTFHAFQQLQLNSRNSNLQGVKKFRPSHEWRAIARARAHTRHKFDKACDHRTPWF